jgi:hypothetical protein
VVHRRTIKHSWSAGLQCREAILLICCVYCLQTTAAVLTWTLYCLAQHPQHVATLHAEVLLLMETLCPTADAAPGHGWQVSSACCKVVLEHWCVCALLSPWTELRTEDSRCRIGMSGPRLAASAACHAYVAP